MTPPIVFLDFDGVLNSEKFFLENNLGDPRVRENDENHFDTDAVKRLNRLVLVTGASVVVSSTWRKLLTVEQLAVLLFKVGFIGDVIDATPDHSRRPRSERPHERGDEIAEWWDLHRPDESYDRFVVFDDDNDMRAVRSRFIKTDFRIGLQESDVDAAIEKLGFMHGRRRG